MFSSGSLKMGVWEAQDENYYQGSLFGQRMVHLSITITR